MNMDMEDFVGLVKVAIEKEDEDRLYRMWLTIYPDMDKDTYISFGDFKNKSYGNKTKEQRADELRKGFQKQIERENKKSDDEVISDADDILQMLRNNGYEEKK